MGNKKRTPEYNSWVGMKQRCLDKKTRCAHRYLERGIKVCERWLNSFDNFLLDMGTKPGPKYSVERIDNDGDYEPGNCKWDTRKNQSRNTSKTVKLTYLGETLSMAEWAERFNIKYYVFFHRIKKGWDIEKALLTPVVNQKKYLTYNGETKSINEWAAEKGISHIALYKRVFNFGWTIEEALNETSRVYLEYKGEKILLTDLAKERGMYARTLHSRIFRQGMSVSDAINKPIVISKRRNKPTLIAHSFGFINA